MADELESVAARHVWRHNSSFGICLWKRVQPGAAYLPEIQYRIVDEWLDPITIGILAIRLLWFSILWPLLRLKSA
jgi:hypothetical protein